VLVYPLVDTLRIFIFRLVRGVSPFSADRNHIHHQILDLGFSHKQTVLLLYVMNLFVIALAVLLRNMDTSLSVIVIGSIVILLSQLPFLFKKIRNGIKKDIIL
jgi:UDP-GlcNAc:undecaprenyl-phosphate/decaprenyl-phosphate GlcNAc-1-phosphate transferase